MSSYEERSYERPQFECWHDAASGNPRHYPQWRRTAKRLVSMVVTLLQVCVLVGLTALIYVQYVTSTEYFEGWQVPAVLPPFSSPSPALSLPSPAFADLLGRASDRSASSTLALSTAASTVAARPERTQPQALSICHMAPLTRLSSTPTAAGLLVMGLELAVFRAISTTLTEFENYRTQVMPPAGTPWVGTSPPLGPSR